MAKRKVRSKHAFKFKMTNLPGEPWFTYHVFKTIPNKEIIFSSIEPGKLQYQAEHFSLTPIELAEGLARGIIKPIKLKYGKNPGAAWHAKKARQLDVEHRRWGSDPYLKGMRDAHGESFKKSRLKKNPLLTVFGNPPKASQIARRVFEVRYEHTADGKAYRHPFELPDVRMSGLPDGSLLIWHPRQRLWGQFK